MMYLGKNSTSARDRACQFIRDLDPSKAWAVDIKPYRRKRTSDQNRYYWGVVLKIIADETGHEAQDLHEYFLGMIYGWQEYTVLGELRKRPARRSSDMKTDEMSAYWEAIRAWAAQNLGIYIPEPGE